MNPNQPGQTVVTVQPTGYATKPVQDYLCYSIFTTLCCCFPLGVAALVFSFSTRNANFAGQQELAEKNSRTARTLNHVALGIGLFFITLAIIIKFAVLKD